MVNIFLLLVRYNKKVVDLHYMAMYNVSGIAFSGPLAQSVRATGS